MQKLRNELSSDILKKAFDLMRKRSDLFSEWRKQDIEVLLNSLKVLSYHKNTTIISDGEKTDFFGFVLSGRVLITKDERIHNALNPGEVLGYLPFLHLPGTDVNHFTLKGEREGFVAVMRFDDLKIFAKKHPGIFINLTKLMLRLAIKVLYHQFKGVELGRPSNLAIKDVAQKNLVEQISHIPKLDSFFLSLEKGPRRMFCNALKYVELESEVL